MNRFNRQVGDWIKLHSGHMVIDRDNPRRVGRIEAIRHGFFAVVKWADTGWTTKLPIERLDVAESKGRQISPSRPATVKVNASHNKKPPSVSAFRPRASRPQPHEQN